MVCFVYARSDCSGASDPDEMQRCIDCAEGWPREDPGTVQRHRGQDHYNRAWPLEGAEESDNGGEGHECDEGSLHWQRHCRQEGSEGHESQEGHVDEGPESHVDEGDESHVDETMKATKATKA